MTEMLWRRLDVPGHDSARLTVRDAGAELVGMSVFHERGRTALQYHVRCESRWRPMEATITGWVDARSVALDLQHDADGTWRLNGKQVPAVDGCMDLDLSFTPATNLLAVRRLDLPVGAEAEVRSAWLEWPDVRLTPLVQRYRRRSVSSYDYESYPPGDQPYVGVLEVDGDGWVLDYPGLWQAEIA